MVSFYLHFYHEPFHYFILFSLVLGCCHCYHYCCCTVAANTDIGNAADVTANVVLDNVTIVVATAATTTSAGGTAGGTVATGIAVTKFAAVVTTADVDTVPLSLL